MGHNSLQWAVFLGLTVLMAAATWVPVARMGGRSSDSNREYFLAGGSLTWPFIAGSITLTNLSTDQLVGFASGVPVVAIAAVLAAVGAGYAISGGLWAVAYAGVGILGMAALVTFLALKAIHFDFSGIPIERLSMIGGAHSPIPFATLIFIQMFYWSTNQTITQRAMAAPNLREGQKGILAAGVIRLAAFMAAAVLTGCISLLNSSVTLYVCDLHEKFLTSKPNAPRLNTIISVIFMLVSIALCRSIPARSRSSIWCSS